MTPLNPSAGGKSCAGCGPYKPGTGHLDIQIESKITAQKHLMIGGFSIRMKRRRFLQAASVGGAVGLAGCAGWVFDSDKTPSNLVSPQSALQWRVKSEVPWPSAPAAADDAFFIGGSAIQALDPDSGDELWRAAGEGTPAVWDGTVYVTGLGRVIALDAESGDEQWTYTLGDPSRVPESPVAVTEDAVYAANGALHAIDRSTGDKLWKNESVSGVLGASESIVCIDAGAGFLYGIDPASGEELWNRIGTWDRPVASDEAVYVADGEVVLKLDARSGDIQWTSETDTDGLANTVSNQTLYVSSSHDGVYRLDTESGDARRVVSVESHLSPPSVRDETVFVGADSRLYGFPRDGDQWTVDIEPREKLAIGPVSPASVTRDIVCVNFRNWTYGLDLSSY